MAILTAYGQALVSSNDPQIKRFLLMSLNSLNRNSKLFGRAFFKQHLLQSFHCALINALFAPEGALHIDLLLEVCYTMHQVDLTSLMKCFASLGFATNTQHVQNVCMATVSFWFVSTFCAYL